MTAALRVPVLGRSLFPGASVALDFTRNLYRSGSPIVKGSPPLLSGWSFTRASTGYAETSGGVLVPFASGAPRITDKGLLVEEARTNLLLRSQEFDTTWIKTNVTITANAVAAPDGTVTADKIEISGVGPQIVQNAVVAATSATFSMYVKQGSGPTECRRFGIRNTTTATNLLFADLNYSTGAISYVVGASGASAVALGDGWWRVILTVTAGLTSGDTLTIYAGASSGTAGHFLYGWGAQLEAGSFATSYIPTAGASATRAKDAALITGLSVTAPFTTLADFAWTADGAINLGGRLVFDLDAGSNTQIYLFNTTAGAGALAVEVAGVTQATLTVAGAAGAGVRQVLASRIETNNFRLARGGTLSALDSSGTAPTGLTQLGIGSTTAGTASANAYIERLAIYPYAMTDAQLQAAST